MEIHDQMISSVQGLYNRNDCVRAILDFFAGRERDPRNGITPVKLMYGYLDGNFEYPTIREAFEALQNCNCGGLKKGKRGKFQWIVSARDLATQMQRPDGVKTNGNGLSSKEDSATETFDFPIRPGITLPITIRRDMGYQELINLSAFIKVIAESRRIPANGENNANE